MALKVSRVDVWVAKIKDKPGAAAEKLAALAEAGAGLEYVVGATRDKASEGAVIGVAPLKGAAQCRAARKAGFARLDKIRLVRVEGLDKKGRGAEITQALAKARINLLGLNAVVIGRKFVCHLMLRKPDDATKAIRVLKKL